MTSTEKISFEQLPRAVSDLKEEVSGLKDLTNTLIHSTNALWAAYKSQSGMNHTCPCIPS